jgi:hypothetical protein
MKIRAFLALALLGSAVPAALRADWIVTREGERFEVRGAPQLKGKLVVFTLPDGSLSSMRADRVDLDASKRATEQAKKAAETPPAAAADAAKPKRKALIVLTDKDFKKPLPAGPGDAAAVDAKDAKDAKAAAKGKDGKDVPSQDLPSSIEVARWERVPASESTADGLEIVGMVHNVSTNYLTGVIVVAQLFDDNGGLIGRFPATVENQVLRPSESSKFRLVAKGTFAFASIRWETQGRGFKAAPPPPPPAPPG